MNAIALGGAGCVWRDVATLERMIGREWDGLVIAVNDVGVHWTRRLDHWCSYHPEKLIGRDPDHPRKWPWVRQRAARGHPGEFETWSRAAKKAHTDHRLNVPGGGSSGLFAVEVARHLGVTHLVLCGVPMDKQGHFSESGVHQPRRRWSTAGTHFRRWEERAHRMEEWVRSMSGQTRELLGYPTLEWLEEEAHAGV